jgi:hypothetical protein
MFQLLEQARDARLCNQHTPGGTGNSTDLHDMLKSKDLAVAQMKRGHSHNFYA